MRRAPFPLAPNPSIRNPSAAPIPFAGPIPVVPLVPIVPVVHAARGHA